MQRSENGSCWATRVSNIPSNGTRLTFRNNIPVLVFLSRNEMVLARQYVAKLEKKLRFQYDMKTANLYTVKSHDGGDKIVKVDLVASDSTNLNI